VDRGLAHDQASGEVRYGGALFIQLLENIYPHMGGQRPEGVVIEQNATEQLHCNTDIGVSGLLNLLLLFSSRETTERLPHF
jgi:hypothetical protein